MQILPKPSNEQANVSKRHAFALLDGIRGLAALFVFIRHTYKFWNGNPFFHSYLAVDMFFLLSGFVIGHAYEEKMASGRISFAKFVRIRLVRLYPMYFLALVIGALVLFRNESHLGVLTSHGKRQMLVSFVLGIFFLPGVYNVHLSPFNGPFWSLVYEFWSNMLYGASRRWLSNRNLCLAVFALAVALGACAICQGSLDSGYLLTMPAFLMAACRSILGLAGGLLVRRFYQQSNAAPPASGRMGSWLVFLPFLLLSACLMVPDLGRFNPAFDLASVILIFPLCLYCGAKAEASGFVAGASRILGNLSYPLYVLHMPVNFYLIGRREKWIVSHAPLSGLMLFVCMIAVCLILERFFERPARKFLAGRLLY